MASEEVDADVISCGCTPLIVTWPKLSLTVVFPMGGGGAVAEQGSVEKLDAGRLQNNPEKKQSKKSQEIENSGS